LPASLIQTCADSFILFLHAQNFCLAQIAHAVPGTREALNKSMFVIPNRRQVVRNILYSLAPEDFSLRSK